MLVIKYSKRDGAEFISHLDTLRHLQKIFIRAKIPVKYSQGYNPHMLLYMSAPLGVGIKSDAEYLVAETDYPAKDFIDAFNNNAPRGIKCLWAINCAKKPNLQALMDGAEYQINGINPFDTEEFMAKTSILATDKRGEQKEIRDKILDLKFTDNGLIARLSFGNTTLRPDVLGEKLVSLYGGEDIDVLKTRCFIKDKTVEGWLQDETNLY